MKIGMKNPSIFNTNYHLKIVYLVIDELSYVDVKVRALGAPHMRPTCSICTCATGSRTTMGKDWMAFLHKIGSSKPTNQYQFREAHEHTRSIRTYNAFSTPT